MELVVTKTSLIDIKICFKNSFSFFTLDVVAMKLGVVYFLLNFSTWFAFDEETFDEIFIVSNK